MKKILNRVPEVTGSFWIIKVLATTVGETLADYLSVNLKFGLSVTSYVNTVHLRSNKWYTRYDV